MQVNATLIAAQQAARDAQARFQTAQFTPAKQTGFAAALEQEGFAPLPLKATQSAAPQGPAPDASPSARPGSRLDIRV